MAIGAFRSFTLDVGDLDAAERFWAAVLGWEVQFSAFNGEYTRIGRKGETCLLLQKVPETKTALKNRAHVDLTVDDISAACEQIVSLGGSVVRPAATWPSQERPILESAVVADPFGNEFCVVRDLRPTL